MSNVSNEQLFCEWSKEEVEFVFGQSTNVNEGILESLTEAELARLVQDIADRGGCISDLSAEDLAFGVSLLKNQGEPPEYLPYIEEEVFTSKTHKLYDEDMVGAAKARAIAIMQAEGPIWGKYGFSWEEWTDEVGKGIDWLVTTDGIVVPIDMLFPF